MSIKKITKAFSFIAVALLLLGVFAVGMAEAADTGYKITTSLPGTDIVKGQSAKDYTLQQYVRQLYLFSLSIVGLLALAAITYHSVRYILAAGNSGKMGDAMGGIWDAILGLVLLLLAATILLFINPNLVNLGSFDDYLPAIPGTKNAPTAPTPTWIQKSSPAYSGLTSCSQIVGYLPATGCNPATEPAPIGNNLCCIRQ